MPPPMPRMFCIMFIMLMHALIWLLMPSIAFSAWLSAERIFAGSFDALAASISFLPDCLSASSVAWCFGNSASSGLCSHAAFAHPRAFTCGSNSGLLIRGQYVPFLNPTYSRVSSNSNSRSPQDCAPKRAMKSSMGGGCSAARLRRRSPERGGSGKDAKPPNRSCAVSEAL